MSDPSNNPHLLKWAECHDRRVTISEFWEWLQQRPRTCTLSLWELDVEKLLDEYFEINRAELDQARRALLAACASMPVFVVDVTPPNPVS